VNYIDLLRKQLSWDELVARVSCGSKTKNSSRKKAGREGGGSSGIADHSKSVVCLRRAKR